MTNDTECLGECNKNYGVGLCNYCDYKAREEKATKFKNELNVKER